jgi:hypothetical protein
MKSMTNTKRGRKPKYLHTIILNGINARDVYKQYKNSRLDDSNLTPILEYSSLRNGETTQVTEFNKFRPVNMFYDAQSDSKHITMIDHINYGCLPDRTNLSCFHCRHPFNTSPIGIPIQYIRKKPDNIKSNSKQIEGVNDYFLTYGIVCSFPCCLAFVKEHTHNPLYRQSKSLLFMLYHKIYGTTLKIKAAPSWECLEVYGGNLKIEEFRKSFCSCNYVITPNIKRPFMVSVGRYIEERRCGYI